MLTFRNEPGKTNLTKVWLDEVNDSDLRNLPRKV